MKNRDMRKYSQETLQKVVDEGKLKKQSMRAIVKKFKVPRTTLRRALCSVVAKSRCRPQIFDSHSSRVLILRCVIEAKSKMDVRVFAYEIATGRGLRVPPSWVRMMICFCVKETEIWCPACLLQKKFIERIFQ